MKNRLRTPMNAHPLPALPLQKSPLPLLLSLFALSLFCYSPLFWSTLPSREDQELFNQIQTPFSLSGFLAHWQAYRHFAYQPLARLSLYWDYLWWGHSLFGFYTTNLLLHFLNSFLFFSLLSPPTRRPPPPISTPPKDLPFPLAFTALYLLHPLQVQTLATFSGRGILLGLFFLLTSSLFAWKKSLSLSPKSLSPSACIFWSLFLLLGFFSWEKTLLLPLLLSISLPQSPSRRFLIRTSTFIALLTALVPLSCAYHEKTLGSGWQGSFFFHLQTQILVFFEQTLECFFPLNLCKLYEISPAPQRLHLASLLFLCCCGGILVMLRSKSHSHLHSHPHPRSFWIACWLIPLLWPLLPFPQKFAKTDSDFAISFLGVLSLGGYCLFSPALNIRWRKQAFFTLFLCFAILSWNLSTTWKTEQSLWERACFSAKGKGELELAFSYLEAGKASPQTEEESQFFFKQAQLFFEKTLEKKYSWEEHFRCHIHLSLLYQKQQPTLALSHLKEAEKLSAYEQRTAFLKDKLFYVYQNQAILYDQEGQGREAQSYWKKVIELDPQNIHPRLSLAVSFHQFGFIPEAINTLIEVLSLDPQCTLAYLQLGKIYFNQENHLQAKEAFLKILQFPLAPSEEKELWYHLALTNHALYEYEEEEVHLKKVLILDPFFFQARLDLAQLAKKQGKTEEALTYLEEVLTQILKTKSEEVEQVRQIQREISALYLVKASIARHRKEAVQQQSFQNNLSDSQRTDFLKKIQSAHQELRHWIRKAIEIDPENLNAWYEEAFVDKLEGNLLEAHFKFKALLQKNEKFLGAYRELGWIALQQKEREQGLAYFETYLHLLHPKTDPLIQKIVEDEKIQQDLQELRKASEASQIPRALDLVEKILKRDSKHGEAYLWKGLLLYHSQRKQVQEIQDAFQKAARYQPDHWQAFYFLGKLYMEEGQKKEAINWFTLCLSRTLEESYVREIQTYLELLKQ